MEDRRGGGCTRTTLICYILYTVHGVIAFQNSKETTPANYGWQLGVKAVGRKLEQDKKDVHNKNSASTKRSEED